MAGRMRNGRHRWVPVAASAAGVAVAGAVAARWRASRANGASDAPYQGYITRFRLSHEALRRNLDRFVHLVDLDDGLDTNAFGEYLGLYGLFLMVHHESEDRVIFPTLRRYGRLKSTDAAHLDRWSEEHHQVNAAGEALVRSGQRLARSGRAGLREVREVSLELAQLLQPHLASEEELLTPGHLAEMIPPHAVGEMDREARRLFGRARTIPLFFAHSLQADEQKQVFSTAPWIFRKVIFPMMDRRAFSRFVPFAISPSLQV
jgi:hypothetical protein